MPRFSWVSLGVSVAATSLLIAPLGAFAQAAPTAGVHVVQDGETLSQIALDANTDVGSIVALNGLSDANALSVGESLKLSAGSGAAAPPSPTAGARASGTYTVADGDTLWDIAQRFGITTDVLVQLNHLDDSDRLSLGMSLSLPAGASPAAATPTSARSATTAAPSASATTAAGAASTSGRNLLVSYTVQPGENLTRIAHQFNVSAKAIVQATGLDDPNKLAVGSIVKVPVPAREHQVAAGETLRSIAASEKLDLGSLIDFNQIDDPELIRVGQVVLLPIAATAPPSAVSSPSASADSQSMTSTSSSSSAPATQSAAAVPPPPAATPPSSPKPSPSPTASPKPPSTGSPKPPATSKPVARVAVVSAPPDAPTDGVAGASVKLLGSPYVWGGSSPSGFDCSGFVWYIARQLGKPLSRGLFAQYAAGTHPARDQLQIGDLVFFQNTFTPGLSHNGIYIGNGQFVHAADENAGVTISSLNTAYWTSHWFGATRLP